MQIGQKMKSLRQKMDLTQQELADRSELTKGFISLMERDINSPSVDTLSKILEALGTSMGEFFTEIGEDQIVFKEEDFFVGVNEKMGHTLEWVVPNSVKNNMEPVKLILEKDGKSKTYLPNEGEEFGYILKGEVKLYFGNKEYVLKQGETFYFLSDKERYIKNISKGESEVLWVSNPPSF